MTDSNNRLEELDSAQLIEIIRRERGENAKLRSRAQEAEQARDGLQHVVQASQVARWHELAKARKVREQALDDVDGRVKLTDLLGEDGRLDEGKASAALDGLKESHGYYFEQPPAVPASSGSTTHTGGQAAPAKPTWGDFLAQGQQSE
jgi:hypothetical protein